jgi:hypothetical protein
MELMNEGEVTRRGDGKKLAMHLPETAEPETGPCSHFNY